jgi:hypothetical protein
LAWVLLVLGCFQNPARATVGLAEWEVTTPGTNLVCHSDPFLSEHGTCLRPSDKVRGAPYSGAVFVSHVEWWQYFPGYVAGQAKRGFFLFDEVKRLVAYHASEAALVADLKAKGLVAPLTRRLLPQDGWRLTWGGIFRQRWDEFRKSKSYQEMSDAEKAAALKKFEELQEPDIRPEAAVVR